jgi:hypothetical protein
MSFPTVTQIATIDGTIFGPVYVDAAGNIFGEGQPTTGADFIFEIPTDSSVIPPTPFDYSTTGAGVTSGLVAGSDGTLYGTVLTGQSSHQAGGAFMVDPTTLQITALAADSPMPEGPPVVDANGNVFFASAGTSIYEVKAGTNTATLFASVPAIDGPLTIDAAGTIFGITDGGGTHQTGSVFDVTPDGTVTTLVSFGGDGISGNQPSGHLVADAAGNLYGVAENLFEITAVTHEYKVLADFPGGAASEINANQIAVDPAGDIYGTTSGSANNLYELLAGTSTIHTFSSDLNGITDLTYANAHLYGINGGAIDEIVPCYCRGTLILTDRGEKPVEALEIGDRLVTAAGAIRPIRWIGTRSYAGRFTVGNRAVLPVIIRAGALADDVPRRDLAVSPEHAMFIDGALIPAHVLVNGTSVVQVDAVERVDYFHVELETHDVILAENAPSETFLDDNSRLLFHNAASFWTLYPDVGRPEAQYCAPRIEDGWELEAIRQRLALRHGARRAA